MEFVFKNICSHSLALLKIQCDLKPNFEIDKFKKACNKVAQHNKINISVYENQDLDFKIKHNIIFFIDDNKLILYINHLYYDGYLISYLLNQIVYSIVFDDVDKFPPVQFNKQIIIPSTLHYKHMCTTFLQQHYLYKEININDFNYYNFIKEIQRQFPGQILYMLISTRKINKEYLKMGNWIDLLRLEPDDDYYLTLKNNPEKKMLSSIKTLINTIQDVKNNKAIFINNLSNFEMPYFSTGCFIQTFPFETISNKNIYIKKGYDSKTINIYFNKSMEEYYLSKKK